MARPLSTAATITPKLRGVALYVHCLIRGLKVRHSTGIKIEAHFVGVNGYVKSSHNEHVELNNRLQAIVERYKLAADIAVAGNDVTEERIKNEYQRLVREERTKEAVLAKEQRVKQVLDVQAAQQQQHRRYRDERQMLDVRLKKAAHIPTPAERLQAAALGIEELEALLRVKKLERDNELRKQDQY